MRCRIALFPVLAAILGAGCEGGAVVVPVEDRPFVYVVLGHRGHFAPGEPPAQYAQLLTLADPTEPARYRWAERFEMRPEGEALRFAWRELQVGGSLGYPGSGPREWNYYLPDDAPPGELGAADIEPLGTYSLLIVSEGVRIEGRVTVPGPIEPALGSDGATIVWPRVEGAAGYRVVPSFDEFVLLTDTMYVLSEEELDHGRIHVQAVDRNLWDYLTDPTIARSGIDAGRGVFGGLTEREVTW